MYYFAAKKNIFLPRTFLKIKQLNNFYDVNTLNFLWNLLLRMVNFKRRTHFDFTSSPIMASTNRSSAWRFSVKKVFLEISQNSPENACARISFLKKLQNSDLQLS